MKIQLLFDDITFLSRPGQVSCHSISKELGNLYDVMLNSLVLNDMIDLQVVMICHFYQRVIAKGASC